MTGDPLPPLREVIRAHGLAARKGLGQHFLLDLNLTRRIVRAAGDLTGMTVLEVGPGPGGLTRALVESPARQIVAIERDTRCLDALAPLVAAAQGRLSLQNLDALQFNHATLPQPWAVVANLPYYITSPLLTGWLALCPAWQSLTLMLQAEVADRLCAGPGTKAYGRLTILAKALCSVRKCFAVPAAAFVPPPRVDSAIVHFTPRTDAAAVPIRQLEAITAAAFGQRRKTLRRSLAGIFPAASFESLALDPEWRADHVTVADYIRLARILEGGAQLPL